MFLEFALSLDELLLVLLHYSPCNFIVPHLIYIFVSGGFVQSWSKNITSCELLHFCLSQTEHRPTCTLKSCVVLRCWCLSVWGHTLFHVGFSCLLLWLSSLNAPDALYCNLSPHTTKSLERKIELFNLSFPALIPRLDVVFKRRIANFCGHKTNWTAAVQWNVSACVYGPEAVTVGYLLYACAYVFFFFFQEVALTGYDRKKAAQRLQPKITIENKNKITDGKIEFRLFSPYNSRHIHLVAPA